MAAPGYRWVRVDADYFRNPKTRAAGLRGRSLHLASICWSGSLLTDGHVPEHAVGILLGEAGVDKSAIERVVHSGLWVPDAGGWQIKDYVDENPTRQQVEKAQAVWRERKRAQRRNTETGRYER